MRGISKAGLVGVVVAAVVSAPAMAGTTTPSGGMTMQEKYQALKKAELFTGLPTRDDLFDPGKVALRQVQELLQLQLNSVFQRSFVGTIWAGSALDSFSSQDALRKQIERMREVLLAVTATQRATLAAQMRGEIKIENQIANQIENVNSEIINEIQPQIINRIQSSVVTEVNDEISKIPPPPAGPQGPTGAQGPQGPAGPAGPGAGGPWVSVGPAHAIVAGAGVTSVAPDGNVVHVTFARDVTSCAATATGKGTVPIIATATPTGSQVEVRMFDHEGMSVDVPFSLTLACP